MKPLITSRGKTPDGKWVYGFYAVHHIAYTDNHAVLQGYTESHAIFNDEDKHKSYWTDVIPDSVGHYTGKTDDSKKGKPIFSGDIVSCRSCRVDKTLGQKKLGLIEYDEESASFVIKTADRVAQLGSSSLDAAICVIGNKIDSPKLLTKIIHQ